MSTESSRSPEALEDRFEREYRPAEHDCDPRWDYEIRLDQLDDPLMVLARRRMAQLAARLDTPFEHGHVVPARLDAAHNPSGTDAVGIYCNGTYSEVVILVDLDAHRAAGAEDEAEVQIIRTVEHEVVHAIQEHSAEPGEAWGGEDEAERHRFW